LRRLALLGVLLVLPTSGDAELYRCTDSQGAVSYTGDPHDCRGNATRHETRRGLQSTGASTRARAKPQRRQRAPASSGLAADESAAATWRRKKLNAQAELLQILAQLPRWERLQTSCNRGADTWYSDEAGIKHSVSCAQIAAERTRAEADRARVRDYLDGGLEDECRRAGCLPGWIR
jgi:hypothetical protein